MTRSTVSSRVRPSPRQIQTLAAALLASISGATCVPSDYGGAPFACAQSPRCPEGYFCGADHVCHRGVKPGDIGRAEPWLFDGPAPDKSVPLQDAQQVDHRTPDAASAVLFQDNFSTPGGFVDDGNGTWSVGNGVLTQKKCNAGPDAMVPSKSWTDVRVTVRLRGETVCPLPAPDNFSYAGLLVRVGSIGDCKNRRYYMCAADFANTPNHQLAIVKFDGDVDCADKGVMTQPVGAIQLGTWYTMSFSALGNVLTCSVSGSGLAPTTVTFTDSGAPLASGSAGLMTESATVSFDDFVVVAQ